MAVNLVVAIAFVLAGIGALLLLASIIRRRPLQTAGPSGSRVVQSTVRTQMSQNPVPTAAAPVEESEASGVNRRQFLNRATLMAMSVFGLGFTGGSLAFLWPNRVTGFGGLIRAGDITAIKEGIESEARPFYSSEGRFYLVPYDTDDEENVYVAAGVAGQGLMALYQKCAHLGCRVPFCEDSQWFECPCHGSKYNYAGEVMPGSPAPAGLWRFPMTIEDDAIFVDTSNPSQQPAFGFNSTNQPPEGPHCIASAEGSH